MPDVTQNSAGNSPASDGRPLSVRLSEALRAQLDLIAQLNGRSTTVEIRVALEQWVESSKSDPALMARAEAVRAKIEREAATQREAVDAIFGGAAPAPKGRGATPKQAEA